MKNKKRLVDGTFRTRLLSSLTPSLSRKKTNVTSTRNMEYFDCHDGDSVDESKCIYFYSNAKPPYFKLSNFYKTNVCYNGINYPSSEHAFQAQLVLDKYKTMFSCNGILGSLTTEAFKYLGESEKKLQQKVDFYSRKKMVGILAKMGIKKMKKMGMTKNMTSKDVVTIFLDILVQKYKDTELKLLLQSTGDKYLLEFERSATRLKKKSIITRWGGIIVDDHVIGSNQMGQLLMEVRRVM